MKEKPLIEATASISLAVSCLILKKSPSMLLVLKDIEMMVMRVERTKAPMAMGVALKTYLRSGR